MVSYRPSAQVVIKCASMKGYAAPIEKSTPARSVHFKIPPFASSTADNDAAHRSTLPDWRRSGDTKTHSCSHSHTHFRLCTADHKTLAVRRAARVNTTMPSFLTQRSSALCSLWKEVATAAQAVAKATESDWLHHVQVYTNLSLKVVALSITLG
jgi:hypothetical protein